MTMLTLQAEDAKPAPEHKPKAMLAEIVERPSPPGSPESLQRVIQSDATRGEADPNMPDDAELDRILGLDGTTDHKHDNDQDDEDRDDRSDGQAASAASHDAAREDDNYDGSMHAREIRQAYFALRPRMVQRFGGGYTDAAAAVAAGAGASPNGGNSEGRPAVEDDAERWEVYPTDEDGEIGTQRMSRWRSARLG